MTTELHEADWRVLAEAAAGDAEPSEMTDRRILKEAARIAGERRAALAREQTRRRWIPGALAASLALVAIGIGFVVMPGQFGAAGSGDGGDLVVPADAGQGASAPALAEVEVPLQFGADGVSLLPTDQDQLAAALSQIDPCSPDVRLRLDLAARDARAEPRAEAVAGALRTLSGERCTVRVMPAAAGRDLAGATAVLILARTKVR